MCIYVGTDFLINERKTLMKITLSNGTIYEAVSANYGETLSNGVKTFTAVIYSNDIFTLIEDIVKGEFETDIEGYKQVIPNMEKVSRYIVNPDLGTIQVWLEEISETDKTISDLKAQLAYQGNAFNDLLINILPEMMMETTEGGTNG